MTPLTSSDMHKNSEQSSLLVRKLLTHAVELDLNIRDDSSNNSDPLNLISKSDEEVWSWYETAMSICETASSLPCDSCGEAARLEDRSVPGGLAKLYREAYFGELVKTINPTINCVARRSVLFDKANIPVASHRQSLTNLPVFSVSEILEANSDDDESPKEEDTARDQSAISESLLLPDIPLVFGQHAPEVPSIKFVYHEVSGGNGLIKLIVHI